MERGQLEAFVMVAREGSFSRAAALLDLAQPSVTARVKGLEETLRAPLFVRKGRLVEMTDAGRALLPYALQVLALLDEGAEEARRVYAGGGGRLRLAAIPTACTYLIAPLLYRLHADQPTIEIHLRAEHSPDAIPLVLDDMVELGFLTGPNYEARLETLATLTDHLVLVCLPHLPFAGQRVTATDLTGATLLLMRWGLPGAALRERLLAATRAPGTILEIAVTETVKALTLAGVGIGLLPLMAVRREIEAGELVEVRLDGNTTAEISLLCVHRRDRALSTPAAAFVALLAAESAAYSAWATHYRQVH